MSLSKDGRTISLCHDLKMATNIEHLCSLQILTKKPL